MKRMATRIVLLLFLLSGIPLSAFAETLIPVGQVVGLELNENRITVAAFDDELGTAARNAGLQVGDEIRAVDGQPVHTVRDIQEALNHSKGLVTLTVVRGKEEHTLRFSPAITAEGPKLGLYLRQGVTGIGTVTWYDPETGQFAALGHGVNGSGGSLVPMTGGSAYAARVQSVRRGKAGNPGQLLGAITEPEPVGGLTKNTPRGLFGTCGRGWTGEAMEVCPRSQIRTGSATIRSTVCAQGPRDYSVEIVKIYPGTREDGRDLLIRITDPDLLQTTGGIVQGMSGSPLVQDGKLIGAVTHVLVNDPTMGYGIFIENMLEAAG